MITFRVQYPNKNRSAIQMVVWSRGVRYCIATGVSVQPKEWNKKQQRVRQNSTNLEVAQLTNEALDKAQSAANRTIALFRDNFTPPTVKEFREAFVLQSKSGGLQKEPPIPFFTDYMQSYIEKYRPTKMASTCKALTAQLRKLQRFEAHRGEKLTFNAINMTFYVELSTYFAELGHNDSYFGAIVKVVKQVFREAKVVDKLHDFDGAFSKKFIVKKDSAVNISLSDDELSRIYSFELNTESLRKFYPTTKPHLLQRKLDSLIKARNLFLLGAYSGLRFSDLSRLTEANITDKIRIRTLKTDVEVVIPIHWVFREIMENDENALENHPSAQKFNDTLKELARIVGITGSVVTSCRIGGELRTEIKERWELVRSHTARRSFITNLYLAGVDTFSIMRMSGHKKETTLLKYIKIDNEQSAELLEDNPYFKKKRGGL